MTMETQTRIPVTFYVEETPNPNSLKFVANTKLIEGDSIELLSQVFDDLEILKGCYEELITIASEEGHEEISNYAQDRVLAIAKHIWMIRSTLE